VFGLKLSAIISVAALARTELASFDKSGHRFLDPGERVVGLGGEDLEALVGEQALDQGGGAADVGPSQVDLARHAQARSARHRLAVWPSPARATVAVTASTGPV